MNAEVVGVPIGDTQAIEGLKGAVAAGKHWYIALLEAIRLWSSPEEDYDGRTYHYLVDNEAFDWLMLAERLSEELDGAIPDSELTDLLFFNAAPVELSRNEFKDLIGASKYRTHLNYFYGVIVEQFLILAVVDDIRKERRVLGLPGDNGVADEAHRRIYGADRLALLRQFRNERRYRHLKSMSLSEFDEFTYWLFKYRIKTSDRSCVASHTKKGLAKLHELSMLKARSARATEERTQDTGL